MFVSDFLCSSIIVNYLIYHHHTDVHVNKLFVSLDINKTNLNHKKA